MTPKLHHRPRVRLAVGLLVLGAFVAVALLPNSGWVAAAATCQYGSCDSTSGSTISSLWYAVLAVLVLVAIALGVLLLRRRRRAPAGPVEPWSGDESGGAVGGAEGPEAANVVPEGAGAPYMEMPTDVGAQPPAMAASAGAAAGGAAEEGDIDSLMQELDKISGEILKRGTPGKKGDVPPPDDSTGSD